MPKCKKSFSLGRDEKGKLEIFTRGKDYAKVPKGFERNFFIKPKKETASNQGGENTSK